MGYGYYVREGMERGYYVEDVCHEPSCSDDIDRGLAFLCYACLGYFCPDHLGMSWRKHDCFAGESSQLCLSCLEKEPDDPEEEE